MPSPGWKCVPEPQMLLRAALLAVVAGGWVPPLALLEWHVQACRAHGCQRSFTLLPSTRAP